MLYHAKLICKTKEKISPLLQGQRHVIQHSVSLLCVLCALAQESLFLSVCHINSQFPAQKAVCVYRGCLVSEEEVKAI